MVKKNTNNKKKVSENNTKKREKAKRAPVVGSDENIYSWRTIPISQAMIEKWTERLSTWVQEHPEAKTMTEFIYSLGISRKSYWRLLERHPHFKEEHEKAQQRLGERLWSNAVDKKADWNATRFLLHTYSEDFEKAKQHDASLREQVASAGGVTVVEMEKFPELPSKAKK